MTGEPLPGALSPPSRLPSYILWGAAGASIIVGASFGIATLSAKSDFDDNPSSGRADTVHNRAVISDVGLGLGAILAVTGTIFFLTIDNPGDAGTQALDPAAKHAQRHAGAVAQLHETLSGPHPERDDSPIAEEDGRAPDGGGASLDAADFVAQSERPPIVPINEGQGPFELLRARWLIEGEIAALAAREATKADLALVRTAVETMQQLANKNQETVAADRDFHMRVAAAAHNGALVSVVLYLWDRGRGAMWHRMEEHFQTPEMRASAIREHWAILNALEARNAPKSRAAMRGHLRRVSTDFAQGWELLKGQKAATAPVRRGVRAVRAPKDLNLNLLLNLGPNYSQLFALRHSLRKVPGK